jgi:hypothetical protein
MLADCYGRLLPQPGRGLTAQRWAVLAAAGEHNLAVARVLEAHSDALAILADAGEPVPRRHLGSVRCGSGNAPPRGAQPLTAATAGKT